MYDPLPSAQLNGGQANRVVPYSVMRSQVSPQQFHSEWETQPYRKDASQAQQPSSNQSSANVAQETSKVSALKNIVTAKLVIGLLMGVLLCGIPLVVVSVILAQTTSANNSTSSSVSSATVVTSTPGLPSQCSTTSSLSDPSRLYSSTSCCYSDDCSLTAGWYRINGAAGSQLLIYPVSTGSCGASYPAWFNGTYPSTSGATVAGIVCANWAGNLCLSSYATSISITNCNGYYVFYLTPLSSCSIRYCTM